MSSDEANRICERCGRPYYLSPYHFLTWAGDGERIRESSFCSSCRDYRTKSRKGAFDLAHDSLPYDKQYETCPTCGGDGKLRGGGETRTCALCHGKGVIEKLYFGLRDNPRDNMYPRNPGWFDKEVKERLPKDYDQEGSCFITTACIEAKGLSDNCLELRILRKFRDSILLKDSKGKSDVKEYYEKAPKIVKIINENKNSKIIWDSIYCEIAKAVDLILKKDFQGAYKHYKEISLKLQDKFL